MNENVFNYIVRTAETEWKPLAEGGVNTSGIFLKPLRVDQATGSCVIEGATLAEGDYLYTPPGSETFRANGPWVYPSVPGSRGGRHSVMSRAPTGVWADLPFA